VLGDRLQEHPGWVNVRNRWRGGQAPEPASGKGSAAFFQDAPAAELASGSADHAAVHPVREPVAAPGGRGSQGT